MDPAFLEALELARGKIPSASNIDRVARSTSPEAARWAFGQWELRARGRAKFGRASDMFFTREALEQATHESVADYHASLFPAGAVVADLTTGIGGDLIALASAHEAVGFELDPERAEYAQLNLNARGLHARIRLEDSMAALEEFDFAFADPSRRVGGRRTLAPVDFSPDPSVLAEAMRGMRLGLLKLSPMLDDDFLEGLGGGLDFVSFGGECREALVQLGSEASEGRWAVHVESGERLAAGDEPPIVEQPGDFFYEADPAAIRAHCLDSLCEEYELSALGDSNGYLTGDSALSSPWLKPYRVLSHGRADARATKQVLIGLNASTPEFKQRGSKLDLQKLARDFRLEGTRHVYVAIWPVGSSLRHTILEPL